MKTKQIYFLISSILFIALVARAATLPATMDDLDMELDSYTFWSPTAQFTITLDSIPGFTKTQNRKSKHFLFANDICQVFVETNADSGPIKVEAGDQYYITTFYLIENIGEPSNNLIDQVYMSLENSSKKASTIDIVCNFAPEDISGDSSPSILFEKGLNNIIEYSSALWL